LVRAVRQPVAPKPEQMARVDYDYHRDGTANLFMVVRPSAGWRHMEVTGRRTTGDFAEFCAPSWTNASRRRAKFGW